MVYQGSKNRLAKFLVPIIQKYIDDNNIKTYIEPMCGGANLIDKINCDKRIGADINEEFLRKLSENNIVLISEYNMPDDFKCIWQKERKVLQKSDRVTGEKAVEKLFVVDKI